MQVSVMLRLSGTVPTYVLVYNKPKNPEFRERQLPCNYCQLKRAYETVILLHLYALVTCIRTYKMKILRRFLAISLWNYIEVYFWTIPRYHIFVKTIHMWVKKTLRSRKWTFIEGCLYYRALSHVLAFIINGNCACRHVQYYHVLSQIMQWCKIDSSLC